MATENPGTSPNSGRWMSKMLLVLVAAALVRLVPITTVEHVSPDTVELLDIARHLRETGRPLLSVKAYYYEKTPIVHYGGYERPLLPAVLLGFGSRFSKSPIVGAQWVSFTASIAMILCLMLFARRLYGDSVALAAGIIAALIPSMLTASLYPWSETLSVLANVFVLLILALSHHDVSAAKEGKRVGAEPTAELAAGIAIGLAIAMRPVNLVVVLPVSIYFVLQRTGGLARIRAIFLVLLGPALFLVVNAAVNTSNGAPALMLPQGFLYRVLNYSQGIDFWSQRDPAPSAIAFAMANSRAIGSQVAKQTIAYAYTLVFYNQYLFVWWLALPIITLRIRRLSIHPVAAVALAIAGLNFVAYSMSWATYDPLRFLLTTLVILMTICVGEVFRSWSGMRLALPGRRSTTLPRLMVIGTVFAFGLIAARESYTSFRNYRVGNRFVWLEPEIWNDPAVRILCDWIDRNAGVEEPVVASAFPWLTNLLTRHPAAYWPKDLDTPRSLNEYLTAYPPTVIVFDPKTRPQDASQELLRQMPQWREHRVDRFTVFLRKM